MEDSKNQNQKKKAPIIVKLLGGFIGATVGVTISISLELTTYMLTYLLMVAGYYGANELY